ncbi:MAG: pentapeptide repeat-containing protein [Planctomycetaceae bacterium]|nr:pentapeptide repeat-containing protein [Planctomycetaceae bacterium]MCB9953257.1 pentapeptide repeat-containing protein [Planctomycetaceae bacterium]
MCDDKKPAEEKTYDERLVALIREKGTTGLEDWRERNPEKKINLQGAPLDGVCLRKAVLTEAALVAADLTGADLTGAWLETADLRNANLCNAKLEKANLSGANLGKSNLCGTNARYVIVSGATYIADIADCDYDIRTDFHGVGLASCRIDPALRADLESYVRRQNWEKWYHMNWGNWIKSLIVRPFWLLSDYGRSTERLAIAFTVLSFLFAAIYLIPTPTWFPSWCPTWNLEPFVTNLEVIEQDAPKEDIHVTGGNLLVRSLYFSVVTMTTLGFGDIHANPESIPGHLLLMVQVMLGYVLLGALVTRLSIMFQGMSHK